VQAPVGKRGESLPNTTFCKPFWSCRSLLGQRE
jgi:hypothetical protein